MKQHETNTLKTSQSAISSEQKTQLLTPGQQKHKGWWQQCFLQPSLIITVPLSSSSSLPLVSRSILHGTVARAPLSSRASVHNLQHQCPVQASLEPETRCYTTLLPLCSHSLLHTQSPHGPKLLRFQADVSFTVYWELTHRCAGKKKKTCYVLFQKMYTILEIIVWT